MGEFALYEPIVRASVGADNFDGIVITSSGTAHVKGAYSEITPSTSLDASGMLVFIQESDSADAEHGVDIAIGAAGAERIILPNLWRARGIHRPAVYHCPISLKTGTRISARTQSNQIDNNCRVQIMLLAGGFYTMPPLAIAETVGFVAASTYGTTVDTLAAAGVKGAWTDIGSFANPIKGLILSMGAGTAATGAVWNLDLAINGQIILPDYNVGASAAGRPTVSPLLPVDIPAGTVIQARIASASTAAGTRELYMTMTGFS